MSTPPAPFDLTAHGLTVTTVHHIIPRNAWANKTAYEATAKKLTGLFNENFETYAAGAGAEVKASAPPKA